MNQAIREDRDYNGKNAFHRAASEHNLDLLKEMFEIDTTIKEDLRLWINSESTYGETPLLLSAMLKHKGEHDGLNKKRDSFIDYLLNEGA